LIFVRCDVNSNLQPDPNEQSAAPLRAILLTLNQSIRHPRRVPYRSTCSRRSTERHRHRHLSHVCESSDLAARHIRRNVNPPYDLVVSTFEACFDFTGKLYPGSRDRAYYTGRAMLWIHALAMCKSEEFSDTFPLQLQNTKAQPVALTLNVFYGSTWLGLLNPASYGYLMSDQDTSPHTPNGFRMYYCICPGPIAPHSILTITSLVYKRFPSSRITPSL